MGKSCGRTRMGCSRLLTVFGHKLHNSCCNGNEHLPRTFLEHTCKSICIAASSLSRALKPRVTRRATKGITGSTNHTQELDLCNRPPAKGRSDPSCKHTSFSPQLCASPGFQFDQVEHQMEQPSIGQSHLAYSQVTLSPYASAPSLVIVKYPL